VRTIGDKDLEKLISSIGKEEQAAAQKQAQIDQIKLELERKKKEVAKLMQENADLKKKLEGKFDLPPDIEELSRLIGQQRGEINSKDQQLEQIYARLAQVEAEYNAYRTQMDPIAKNLEAYIGQFGELKGRLMEQDGLIKFKDQQIQELQIEIENTRNQMKPYMDNLNAYANQNAELKGRLIELEGSLRMREKEVAELNIQLDSLQGQSKNLEQQYKEKFGDSYGQLTNLKMEVTEKQSIIDTQEKQIGALKGDLDREKEYTTKLRNEIQALQAKMLELGSNADEIKKNLEAKLREEIFASRDQEQKQIHELGDKILDLEIKNKELKAAADKAEKREGEMKAKYDELAGKYENAMQSVLKMEDEIKAITLEKEALQKFKDENFSSITNLENLVKALESEVYLKMFGVVRKVGEINLEDLKSALGIPTVTVQKYVQLFVKFDIFTIGENGKIALKYGYPTVDK
jgi:chromosome segregation ATPase